MWKQLHEYKREGNFAHGERAMPFLISLDLYPKEKDKNNQNLIKEKSDIMKTSKLSFLPNEQKTQDTI